MAMCCAANVRARSRTHTFILLYISLCSFGSVAAAVGHEFPFKPKIYLVFLHAISMNIQTMLIQLWCSNVRTVKRCHRIGQHTERKRERRGEEIWCLLFFLSFWCDSNGMENKISHFGCFMWMYVSLCLLYSREKKKLFRLSVALAFLLFWHCCVPRAVTTCTKTSGKKYKRKKSPTRRKMENGFALWQQ